MVAVYGGRPRCRQLQVKPRNAHRGLKGKITSRPTGGVQTLEGDSALRTSWKRVAPSTLDVAMTSLLSGHPLQQLTQQLLQQLSQQLL